MKDNSRENEQLKSVCERLTKDISARGYSVVENAVPASLLSTLEMAAINLPSNKYQRAGLGRNSNYKLNVNTRNDKMKWISLDDPGGIAWLQWVDEIKTYLNRALMLGLFSFESHFARYEVGGFYRKHRDAFIGRGNRKLSLLLYLNRDWSATDGGELVIYEDGGVDEIARVIPRFGTLVVFLSEDFPHEVLPNTRPRLSIAGWFRINSSSGTLLDPPT